MPAPAVGLLCPGVRGGRLGMDRSLRAGVLPNCFMRAVHDLHGVSNPPPMVSGAEGCPGDMRYLAAEAVARQDEATEPQYPDTTG